MAVATGTAILGAAAIAGGASILGGMNASKAASSAAQTQADAANNAIAAQNAALERQIQISEPWRTAGTTAVNQLSKMTQPGGAATKDFSYAPFNYNQYTDPGTQFRIQQGLNAMNATAAARGGLISGNALKAGQDYGQAQGSQEYGNAFNRYLQNYSNAQNTFQLNRNNLLQPLQYLSSQGQASAANQAANIGSTSAANTASSLGAANALAAGQVGSANAFNSALGGVGNAAQTAAMMSMYGNRNTSAYGNTGGNIFGDSSGYGEGWGPTGYTG